MIKHFLLLLAIPVLAGCSGTDNKVETKVETKQLSRKDIVRRGAEAEIKDMLGDPASYEFASLELIDSVSYKDNIEKREKSINRSMEFAISQADKAVVEKSKMNLTRLDSIKTALGEQVNEVASYTYSFKFRNKNEFGAKVLNELFVQTMPAPGYEILSTSPDKNKMLAMPNGFPGFDLVNR